MSSFIKITPKQKSKLLNEIISLKYIDEQPFQCKYCVRYCSDAKVLKTQIKRLNNLKC